MSGRSTKTAHIEWSATAYAEDRIAHRSDWRRSKAAAEKDWELLMDHVKGLDHITEVRIDIRQA